MKPVLFALGLALVFSACPVYDSFPEPELPVVYIEFEQAQYDSQLHKIFLQFKEPVSNSILYATYNQQERFYIADYLTGGSGSMVKSAETESGGITITLHQGSTIPQKLTFDTGKPCYLGSAYYIDAKAYIKTQEIGLSAAP
jgi:hypothetical protein